MVEWCDIANRPVGQAVQLLPGGLLACRIRVFCFDPADYRAEYSEHGWVHIREGVSAEFHEHAVEYVRRELAEHLLEGFAIQGKKEQALFEFPSDVDYPDELFDTVADLCGLKRASMTLSERHVQAYDQNAAPEPPAHKDRFPSQVSVGLSIAIPADSRLVLYPYDRRETNPFNTSAGLRRSLQPDELPERSLSGLREVELDDRDRDVVVFGGSTTWHLRRRAAGAINLYLKFNDFDCDPLGEDPHTAGRRRATLDALERQSDVELGRLVPVLSRRLDTVSRQLTRDDWRELLQAQVFGEEPFGLTPSQFEALRGLERRPLAEHSNRPDLLVLAQRGAIDLLPVDQTPRRSASQPS